MKRNFALSQAEQIIDRALPLMQAGELDAATAELARRGGVALKHPLGMNIQASIWSQQDRPVEALRMLDRAARAAPHLTDTHFQRGVVLTTLARYEESAAAFDRALVLRPQFAEILINRAIPLSHLGRFEEALASLDEAVRYDPRNPALLFNRGTLRLLMGDFERGWQDYESRLARPDIQVSRPKVTGVPWHGQALGGKSILVYAEQGFGDTFQFIRLLKHPAFAEARLTFRIDPRLRRVCRHFLEGIDVVDDLESGASFDYVAALLSLPRALGIRLDTIPREIPYLYPDPERKDHWARRLGPGFKVAINWQGNPKAATDVGRSVPLESFAPLAAVPGVRLLSVQKHNGLEQLQRLPAGFAVELLEPFDAGADAFIDLAAILAHVDLVVTSDTAVAHLAGAMGRPVWVALKRVPDWRWLLAREDSPWYPTMRLFRQTTSGDWDEVFARIARALAERLDEDNHAKNGAEQSSLNGCV